MNQSLVTIGNAPVIYADIARTHAEQALGLSGRTSLFENAGMVFVYDEPTSPTFWMHGMKFPIDLLWSRGGVITGIEERMPADGGLALYNSPGQVDLVVEVSAGWIATNGIKDGDSLRVQWPH